MASSKAIMRIALLVFMIAQAMSQSTTTSLSSASSLSSSAIPTSTTIPIESSAIVSSTTSSSSSSTSLPTNSTAHAINLALILGLVLGLVLPLLLVIMLIIVRYFKLEKTRHRGTSDDTAPIILSRRHGDDQDDDDDAWAARPGPYHDANSEPFMKSFDFGERPLPASSSLPQYDPPPPPRNAAPAVIPTHVDAEGNDPSPVSAKSERTSIFKEVM